MTLNCFYSFGHCNHRRIMMTRPSKKSIAMKKYWAKRRVKAKARAALQSIETKRSDITAVPPTSELDDIRVKIERAHELIETGMANCNEGWDLINSIPRRVT
jgi:hypothetical protein